MIGARFMHSSAGFLRATGKKFQRAGGRGRAFLVVSAVLLACAWAPVPARAQQLPPNLYAGMRWRQIGPFRGGRVTGVTGIAGNPAVYYMGTAGGGVWESTDAGMTWQPISDQVHVASIGAIEAAPSNPKILYVGTGDVSDVGGSVNQGDGMYKSLDGGKTWEHIGLSDTRHIAAIWVNPQNPNIVLVAALGHTFAKNEQRGIFKTIDGGKTWRKVLYKDDVTGGIDLAFDPRNPRVGFAALWHHYVPSGDARTLIDGAGGGYIYKTTDEGETWTPVGTEGLPEKNIGRIGVAMAPGGSEVFAIIAARPGSGLYRSDDGGQSWRKVTDDPRVQGSGYFSRVYVDPNHPNVVYVMQTSVYRSTDGGHTFVAFIGAPGGDDYHVLWINPANSDWLFLGSDQGATLSLNGGKSWSSWYNQPTGQIYHMSVDNRWPYWVYGTQQDSGSIGVLSRGDYGAITMLDWDPVAGYEFGYILPDPLDPNILYAGGPGRGLVRIDRTNRQVRGIGPNVSRDGDYRVAVNPPLAFSPQNPHVLYEGTQYVLATRDGGMTWRKLSPDLTARAGTKAKPKAGEPQRNHLAINTLAPSPVRAGEIWVGTTNGLIQLTEDGGKSWKNVSPPGLTKQSLISLIDPSPFDARTAYATVNESISNDFRPHIYRTHDAGKTWQQVEAGIPDGSFVRVVREDTVRRGLLYAGTENGVYVSFDDGDHWQSLQQNLPTVSLRDMIVHGDDLVAATYGRAFWILDDLTPLRQIDAKVAAADAHLFRPETAIRVRRDLNGDTQLPPDIPAGQNPPAGAVLDYYLKAAPSSEIAMAVYDASGKPVRTFSSAPLKPPNEQPPRLPSYWLARPEPLPKNAGQNRFVWDLRYPSPDSLQHNYPISAVLHNTPADPRGPLVVPGKYEVRLTVAGRTYQQPLEVKLDPRVSVAQTDLVKQLELGKKLVKALAATYEGHQQVAALRKALADREKSLGENAQAKAALAAVQALDKKAAGLEGGGGGRQFFGPRHPKPSFALLNGEFGSLLTLLEGADMRPTQGMEIAHADYCKDLSTVQSEWNALVKADLAAVNEKLRAASAQPVSLPGASATGDGCNK
jgi:photosystem II stability/assembly factor-like uncharacterized protein